MPFGGGSYFACVDLASTEGLELPVCDEVGFHQTWRDVIRLQRKGLQPTEFSAIRAPVLLLHGREDPHPGRRIRDSLVPSIRRLEYLEFPRCGHLPWLERHAREAFLAALRSRLRD